MPSPTNPQDGPEESFPVSNPSHNSPSNPFDEQSDSDESQDLGALYIEFQRSGSQRRRWMEDPSEPNCFIPQSNLDYETLKQTCELNSEVKDVPARVLPDHELHGLDPNLNLLGFVHVDEAFTWLGFTALGMIVIESIKRDPRMNRHNISEITHAIYTRNFPIESLKRVYVDMVVNDETYPFVRHHLYRNANNLSWPGGGAQTWDFARDPEIFDMLLGTRCGKMISYLVLGAFPRGTRHIARVVTCPVPTECAVHLRFDIEEIEK
ncbi:hypothetical protein VI817_001573 [Penicillium citrinum]|nr:hypothetical protein VI817_001573 [Penicillium citrinum]